MPAHSPTHRPGFLVATLALIAGCMLVGVLLLWLAWKSTFWAIDRAVDYVPPAWESQLGAATATGMDAQAIDDPVIRGAVDDLFGRLVKHLPADQPYTFHVRAVWDAQENAFALPGGQVMVTSGILAASRTPDEIAGVLGHEIQHVLGKHSFRGMARKLGLAFLLTWFFGDGGLTALIAQGGSELLALSFDRNQEWESDQVGVKLAYQAGYQPRAMADFFERQAKEAARNPTTDRALALLSTHPANSDRIAQIYALAKELPARPRPAHASLSDWNVVRARAAAIPASYRSKPNSSED